MANLGYKGFASCIRAWGAWALGGETGNNPPTAQALIPPATQANKGLVAVKKTFSSSLFLGDIYLRQMWGYIWSELLKAIATEPEPDVKILLMDSCARVSY